MGGGGGGGGGAGRGEVYYPKLYPISFITCLGYNKSKCVFLQNLDAK